MAESAASHPRYRLVGTFAVLTTLGTCAVPVLRTSLRSEGLVHVVAPNHKGVSVFIDGVAHGDVEPGGHRSFGIVPRERPHQVQFLATRRGSRPEWILTVENAQHAQIFPVTKNQCFRLADATAMFAAERAGGTLPALQWTAPSLPGEPFSIPRRNVWFGEERPWALMASQYWLVETDSCSHPARR